MNKVWIKQLEMHISHECNLSCKYCSHYCDFKYKGKIVYKDGSRWIESWAERLNTDHFALLGGEPILNKDLDKYINCAAQHFQNARRELITNGILLRKIEHLLPLLIDTNTELRISLHPVTKRQQALVHDALTLADEWKEHGLKLNITRHSGAWKKFYQGEGLAIKPYSEGQPAKSWRNCEDKYCHTIHQGKLWKCPALAYLPLIFDRLEEKALWEPYMRYTPLTIDASTEQLEEFAKGSFFCCDMCRAEGPCRLNVDEHMPRYTTPTDITVSRQRFKKVVSLVREINKQNSGSVSK